MAQQHYQTHDKLFAGVVRGAALDDHTIRILDDLLPLNGASHADVVEYRVEVPMRYAECVALLKDGRKIGFSEPRSFVGWSSNKPERSLLFNNNGTHIEIGVTGAASDSVRSCIRNIVLEAANACCNGTLRRFIGIDGGLLYLPA
jgi:malate synthase